MISKKVLIIGYGSIGKRHTKILSKIVGNKNIFILTSKKIKNYIFSNNFNEALKFNPDYIVICTPSSDHIKKLILIEKKLSKKIVLVEKPLFSKNEIFKSINNKIFVGYNMRFNPVIQAIKKLSKGKKFLTADFYCSFYLPFWRKEINYKTSASAKKKFGGGVLLDLSHEIDYIKWIFGDIKINKSISKKLSSLKINTDDYFSLSGSTKKIKRMSINLNYFSRKKIRKMIINGNKEFIEADLVKNEIIYISNKGQKKLRFTKYDRDISYKKQHLAILQNNADAKFLCTFSEGKNLVKLLDKMRKGN